MLDEHTVIEALRDVYDPELGVNIVDLGLIYGLTVADGAVTLEMTLTSPGCPLGEAIEAAVRATLADLSGIARLDLRMVWDPPWGPERISDEALAMLGWR